MEHFIEALFFQSLKWKFVSYVIFLTFLNYDHNEFVTLTIYSTFLWKYSEGRIMFTITGSKFQICAFLTLQCDNVNKMGSFQFCKCIGEREMNPDIFNLIIMLL